MKRVAVCGSVSYDIVHRKGRVYESWGGIIFNILSLSLDNTLNIIPVTYVGSDRLSALLKILPLNISTKKILISNGTNVNRLHIIDENNRIEFITPLSPQIELNHLKELSNVDFLHINPVMGKEFSIQTLEDITKFFSCKKMIDIHSMLLGIDKNGKRYFRNLTAKEEDIIFSYFDIIQMNERESQIIMKGRFNSFNSFPYSKIILITKGAKGVLVNYKNITVEIGVERKEGNSIGAGDIFSGAFISMYLKTEDPFESAKFGAKIASQSIGPNTIQEKIQQIKRGGV